MRRHRSKRIALEGLNFAVPVNHVKPLVMAALERAPRRMFAGQASFPLPPPRGKKGSVTRRQFSGSARVLVQRRSGPRVVPRNLPVLGEVRFCREVTVSGDPVGAATVFPADVRSVTALFQYRNVRKHTPYLVAWYHNGRLVSARRRLWRLKRTGFFQTNVAAAKGRSLAPGLYRFEFSLGGRVMSRAVFSIRAPRRTRAAHYGTNG